MELALQLICQCGDSALARKITHNIGPDAPVREEDVKTAELKVFRALEYVEEPDEYFVNDCDIGVIWTLGGDPIDEAEERLLAFHKAGAKKILAYVWADDFEEMFTVKNGKLVRFNDWDRDVFTDFDGDPEREFEYLKKLLELYL